MKARSFSHTGITVANFDKFVQFYADVFGCRLISVSDSPTARVRAFFGIEGDEPKCRIGWLRLPGGGILEIFEFTPQKPAEPVVWNRVGITHIGIDVVNAHKWYEYLQAKGVEVLGPPERSPKGGQDFFFAKDCDGNLIEVIDLRYGYQVLKWGGRLGSWIFRRGMYKQHYLPRA